MGCAVAKTSSCRLVTAFLVIAVSLTACGSPDAASATIREQTHQISPAGSSAAPDASLNDCRDETKWDANGTPIVVERDSTGRERRFLRYLRIYSDSSGESHGEERQMPLEVLPSPGGAVSTWRINPLPALNVQTADEVIGWLNPTHPAAGRRLLYTHFGQGCITTSDGKAYRLWPNRVALLEDTAGKGHETKQVGSQEWILSPVVLSGDAIVPGIEEHPRR